MSNQIVDDYMEKLGKISNVYIAKNNDYGDSFTKSLDEFGLVAGVVRISDKFNRLVSLYDKESSEVEESLVDTLEDLANYAIMMAVYVENQSEEPLHSRTVHLDGEVYRTEYSYDGEHWFTDDDEEVSKVG